MDLIDVVGLDEEIRCEMCRNPMHTNRGCDGHCKYDEKLYERIIQILDKRITPSPSAEPERKTGKWIYITDGHYEYFKCDQCEKHSGEPTPFCRYCGADMREGQDERHD